MIIVRIIGGLGNQMFQYSLYRNLLEKGYNVKIDINDFKDYELHNGFELNKIFKLNMNFATLEEVNKLKDNKSDFLNRARRKLLGYKKSYFRQSNQMFIPSIFKIKGDLYLDGYWQSENYFDEIKGVIKDDFSFKNFTDEKNQELMKSMESNTTVSLHVRRGDYVNDPVANKVHGGIVTKEYYLNAIRKIESKVGNEILYIIFSDDITWAKENITGVRAIYVDWNKGLNSYKDMQLMAMCKHNIIANSSFSWWGAWLNSNEDKIVVAPDKWLNNQEVKDIIPANWIQCSRL